jgi:hypothetical protein
MDEERLPLPVHVPGKLPSDGIRFNSLIAY